MNIDSDFDASEDYKKRLRTELVSRDGHGEIYKDATIFLRFKDAAIEKAYSNYREPYSSVPLIASLLVQIVGVVYSLFIHPLTAIHFAIVLPLLMLIAFCVFISVAESFPGVSMWIVNYYKDNHAELLGYIFVVKRFF